MIGGWRKIAERTQAEAQGLGWEVSLRLILWRRFSKGRKAKCKHWENISAVLRL
jgi:hypothetical protein